jgi:hypothetical protein
MVRWATLLAFALGLLVVGLVGAVFVGVGCDENLHPGTARSDVCTTVGDPGGLGWWSLACTPAILFSAAALVGGGRPRVGVLAGAIFTTVVALDAVLIAIVTSNLLA